MEVLVGVVVGLALGAAGLWMGVSRGKRVAREESRDDMERRLRPLVESLSRGGAPSGLEPGSPEADLWKALEEGWAPRGIERQAALREAIGRVSSFLESNVRAPLTGFDEGASEAELRRRIDRALGALQDLNFFIQEPPTVQEGADLVPLVQRVSREFVSDQSVGVRLGLSGPGVRAEVNVQALMDALYLVLHNAARFGDGQTIDLSVQEADGRAKITVRDHGSGFSEEAFRRAFDPFYSTSSEGLGLGLPHARMVVEEMGGEIELRNVPDGGAEVEISFRTC